MHSAPLETTVQEPMTTVPSGTHSSKPLAPLAPHSPENLQLLDDVQEWSAFSRPSKSAPDGWESSVVIEGMHCAACSYTVEDAIAAVPGVLQVQVSAGSQRAKVVWNAAEVKPSTWMLSLIHI